ncbi:hypothetical protein BDR03DRAFT_170232 [Suillus americanus]|nr:hypothetical protein BDR03DRAFT_170232 [Suillus americanus]
MASLTCSTISKQAPVSPTDGQGLSWAARENVEYYSSGCTIGSLPHRHRLLCPKYSEYRMASSIETREQSCGGLNFQRINLDDMLCSAMLCAIIFIAPLNLCSPDVYPSPFQGRRDTLRRAKAYDWPQRHLLIPISSPSFTVDTKRRYITCAT